jgi:hypothetical protein
MKRTRIAAGGLLTLMVAATALAGAEPPFESYYDSVNGLEPPGTPQIYFFAESYDDLSGIPTGSASVTYWHDGEYFQITCSGPDLAGAVSIHEKSGKAEIYVVLDPDAPYCTTAAPPHNVKSPVVLNLRGRAGDYHTSEVTTTKSWSPGAFSQTTASRDYFTETYTGTAPVSYPSFRGYAIAKRITEKTR